MKAVKLVVGALFAIGAVYVIIQSFAWMTYANIWAFTFPAVILILGLVWLCLGKRV